MECELPLVYSVLEMTSPRDRALVALGLNTGFRVSELLSLNVGDVWDGERVRPHVKVARAVMGRSSCATTQKYLHVDEEEMVQAVMALAAPVAVTPPNEARA